MPTTLTTGKDNNAFASKLNTAPATQGKSEKFHAQSRATHVFKKSALAWTRATADDTTTVLNVLRSNAHNLQSEVASTDAFLFNQDHIKHVRIVFRASGTWPHPGPHAVTGFSKESYLGQLYMSASSPK